MKTMRTLFLPLVIAATLAACGNAVESTATTSQTSAADAVAVEQEAPAIQAESGTYAMDPGHTNVLASWTHFGFSKPTAHFGLTEGTLVYDAADVGNSSVNVSLSMTDLTSFVPALDEHLKNADFFDAGQFPTATFKSTHVEAAGTNKLTVTGDLTIKGITKPVTLDVVLNGAGMHPMLKKQAIGFSATGSIKRSDFDVAAYAPNISDDVQLSITTEAAMAEASAEAQPEVQE